MCCRLSWSDHGGNAAARRLRHNTTAQSGSTEAEEVFDSANGFTGSPSTSILDGRRSTFVIGFGVADPADVVMEVRPGFDYNSAIFTS